MFDLQYILHKALVDFNLILFYIIVLFCNSCRLIALCVFVAFQLFSRLCSVGWGWNGGPDLAVRELSENLEFTAQREHGAVFLGQQFADVPSLRLRPQVGVREGEGVNSAI